VRFKLANAANGSMSFGTIAAPTSIVYSNGLGLLSGVLTQWAIQSNHGPGIANLSFVGVDGESLLLVIGARNRRVVWLCLYLGNDASPPSAAAAIGFLADDLALKARCESLWDVLPLSKTSMFAIACIKSKAFDGVANPRSALKL